MKRVAVEEPLDALPRVQNSLLLPFCELIGSPHRHRFAAPFPVFLDFIVERHHQLPYTECFSSMRIHRPSRRGARQRARLRTGIFR